MEKQALFPQLLNGVMSTLQKRLFFSAIFVTITIFTIFFSSDWFFFLVIEAFCLLGFNEYMNLTQKKGFPIHRPMALILGAMVPFFVVSQQESFVLVLACFVLLGIHFHPKLRDNALGSTALTLFGLIYVVWFFGHALKIRELYDGEWLVFYIILIVKGGDAGAYFVGRKLGKHKLIPHISPNKSVEGAIAGLATAVTLSLVSKIYLDISIFHLLILGISVGILAQIADLAESLIKRDVGVKDSGEIPGLGGILDMLDSLLLTFPFVYYYITMMGIA